MRAGQDACREGGRGSRRGEGRRDCRVRGDGGGAAVDGHDLIRVCNVRLEVCVGVCDGAGADGLDGGPAGVAGAAVNGEAGAVGVNCRSQFNWTPPRGGQLRGGQGGGSRGKSRGGDHRGDSSDRAVIGGEDLVGVGSAGLNGRVGEVQRVAGERGDGMPDAGVVVGALDLEAVFRDVGGGPGEWRCHWP